MNSRIWKRREKLLMKWDMQSWWSVREFEHVQHLYCQLEEGIRVNELAVLIVSSTVEGQRLKKNLGALM